MGELICLKCKAKIKADTFEQADEQIDHSVGKSRGHLCDGSDLNLRWNDKPVASIVYHIGPGSKDYVAPGARKSKAENEDSKKDESKKDDSKKESEDKKSESKSSPKEENSKNSSTVTKN